MQLLRDNVTLWTSDMSNESEESKAGNHDDGTVLQEAEDEDKD
jgi:hypothetical protein